MNSLLTTVAPRDASIQTKTILAQQGYHGSLVDLAADSETPRFEGPQSAEQLLFVVEGKATVRFDRLNTILVKNEALHIDSGKDYTIAATDGPATLLRVEIPPRQITVAPLIAVER